MSISSGNKHKESFSEINITPLTDIFLVLLIIMMVIAPLLDQQGLNLAVPQIGVPDQKKDFKVITVDIDTAGKLNIDGKVIEKDKLIPTIKSMQKEKKDGLIIEADPESKHQDVVFVMDAARSAGVENISLMEKQMQAK